MELVHTHLYFTSLVLLYRSVEAHFDLIKVDMNELFTICADLRNLTVEVDGIAATWTARDDDSDNFRFLLHLEHPFEFGENGPFEPFEVGFCTNNITIKFKIATPIFNYFFLISYCRKIGFIAHFN